MGLFDAIASSAASLTDNVVGMVNQNHQNKVNLRMMREQNAFNDMGLLIVTGKQIGRAHV